MDSEHIVGSHVTWRTTELSLSRFLRAERGPLWLAYRYWMACRGSPYIRTHYRSWEALTRPPSDELFEYMTESMAITVVSEPNPSDWTILVPGSGVVPFKSLPSFNAMWPDFLYCKQKQHPYYHRIQEISDEVVSDLTRLLLPVSAGPEVSRVHAIYRQTVEVTTELELEMHQ